MNPGPSPAWRAAVFTSREDPAVVLRAVDALEAAALQSLDIEVVVNGQPSIAQALAEASAQRARQNTAVGLSVWSIPLGDKAHAINEFLHRLWRPADIAFCIDGYVRVKPNALAALAAALHAQPAALAGTGVPTVGLGAASMRRQILSEGGIHGNLFALKAATVRAVVDAQVRLPLGMYRTDGVLAAALAFNLDPAAFEWDVKGRVVAAEAATWLVERPPLWHPDRWRAQWRRRQRQAQGDLENRAVSAHLATQRRAPGRWAPTASELVSRWAEENREAWRVLMRSARHRQAWENLMQERDWTAAAKPPQLLWQRPRLA
jgi:hypothetical protein